MTSTTKTTPAARARDEGHGTPTPKTNSSTAQDSPQPRPLPAALAYAAHGWPVFPVALAVDGRCTCGWPPHRCDPQGKIGKHPLNRGGRNTASTDPRQITAWWRRWPTANVGIASGEAANLGVLDVDGEDGRASLARIEAEHGPLPGTVTAITSRGCHLLYQWTPGLGIGAGFYGDGLDHRGQGGYIIAPPSRHPSGHIYRWLTADDSDPAPWSHPLPAWPAGALPVQPVEPTRPVEPIRPVVVPLRPTPGGRGALSPNEILFGGSPERVLDGLVRFVLDAPKPTATKGGQRNTRLHWAACRVGEHVAAGRFDRPAAELALQLAAEHVGLTEAETKATIASGVTKGLLS
jgi:hypothetical protein